MESVQCLIEAGADIGQVSAGDHTSPLLMAVINGHFDIAMYLLAQRIESYRAAQGVLPASLDALQDSVPGVTYAVLSDSLFELTTSRAGAPIVFRSDDSVDAFLGNATAIVQGYR